jgi:cbb3-type cytochrome oxidase subunit 3
MTLVALVGSATTVLSVAAFVVVMWWAYGRSRRTLHANAGTAPFAVPDEIVDGRHAAEESQP